MTNLLTGVTSELSHVAGAPAADMEGLPLLRIPDHLVVRSRVLSAALFKDAILRERKRSDRFDTSFAVLLVDRGQGADCGESWRPILSAVAAVKRDIDVVGWLEKDRVLGLLLPEVSSKDAREMMEMLRTQIGGCFGGSRSAALSLYAHDEHGGRECDGLPSVDILLEACVQRRRHRWRDGVKRVMDVVGSLLLLVAFAPVLLLVVAAVKCTSRGPALYRQERIGQNGETFTMLKFRTMYVNAGHDIHEQYMSWFINCSDRQPLSGNQMYKLTNDPRITCVGRVLRKGSFDELPQFWNVLRGDMSLVGPRPPLPFEVKQYRPWHLRRVLEAKPGITGSWQVSGRSSTTFDEMVRLDLRYAMTHSLWTDIKILALTPWAVITGKGAC